jgi:hypothetical protein
VQALVARQCLTTLHKQPSHLGLHVNVRPSLNEHLHSSGLAALTCPDQRRTTGLIAAMMTTTRHQYTYGRRKHHSEIIKLLRHLARWHSHVNVHYSTTRWFQKLCQITRLPWFACGHLLQPLSALPWPRSFQIQRPSLELCPPENIDNQIHTLRSRQNRS